MKKFEILHKLPKCGSETQAEQTLLENWCQSIVSAQGCLKPSIGEKHVSAKLSEPKSHKARPVIPQTLEGELEKLLGKNVEPNEDQTLKECLTRLKKRMIIYIYI